MSHHGDPVESRLLTLRSLLRQSLLIILGLVLHFPSALRANPSRGQVSAGSVAISTAPGTVTINQTSNAAIINWQSFSINPGELTKFVQPSATSAVLNRVLGGETSLLNGTLSANGQVYLINGNGITVGSGGVINTASFLASTRDITDSDFLSGNLHFAGSSEAGVQNLGVINALGGDVILIGKSVSNQGAIKAPNGTVGLAAADDILIAQTGTEHVFVSPSAATASASGQTGVNNSGVIQAGAAELRAANGNIYALAIQNTGTIRATTVTRQGGHIWLTSDAGTVANSGILDASATATEDQGGTVALKAGDGLAVQAGQILARGGAGGVGGNAEVSGKSVQLTGTADLTAPGGTTGNLLLDPSTLTVVTGGVGAVVSGENDSNSTIDPSTVATALGTANLILNANTNITVSNGITWTSANTLTLSTNASGSTININAGISGANGGLTLNPAGVSDIISTGPSGTVNVANFILQTGAWTQNSATLPAFAARHDFEIQGGSFLRVTGGDGTSGTPYQITDVYGLQGVASLPLGNDYVLANNIDASGTVNWNANAGFTPIAGGNLEFAGTFNGQGHVISNLTINQSSTSYVVGLFGSVDSGGVIENLGLTAANVSGGSDVGALAGANYGIVQTCYSTGSVTGNGVVGGLVSYNMAMVQASYSTCAVNGAGGFCVGGLVGINNSSIEGSYSTGTVTGGDYSNDVGGLVGSNNGPVGTSYSTGAVTVGSNSRYIGGLTGVSGGAVNSCYSTGAVTAGPNSNQIGGLVGYATNTVQTSYSTGAVSAGINSYEIGGLVGYNQTGTVQTCYSTGAVLVGSGSNSIGGLIGRSDNEPLPGNVPAESPANYGGVALPADSGGNGSVATSYSTGTVTAGSGSTDVGGLMGVNGSTVQMSYSTGIVTTGTGSSAVGGLVGDNYGIVQLTYSTGAVTGSGASNQIGGLVGYNEGTVQTSYSTGSVTGGSGSSEIGGLVGYNDVPATVQTSYSTGAVSGVSGFVGGLIGENNGTVSYSFWDTTTSGQSTSAGGTSETTAQMLQQLTFVPVGTGASNWDFTVGTGVWGINGYANDGHGNAVQINGGLPYFQWQYPTVQVKAGDQSVSYSGVLMTLPSTSAYTVSGPSSFILSGPTLSVSGTNISAGTTDTIAVSAVPQIGDAVEVVTGTLTITPAILNVTALSVTANNANKIYDGLAYYGGNGVSYSGFVDGQTASVLGGTLTYSGNSQGAVNAGSYTIIPGGLTSSNYTITFDPGTLTISPAALTISTNPVTKTYDGTNSAAGSAVVTEGQLYGTDSLSGGSFAFADPNAGANKTVTVSNVTVSDGNIGNNYTVSYVSNTASTINPALLTVTANNASKTYDGLAYSGGSGVSYTGLVDGQTASVLEGTLSYSRNSQGAMNAGSYSIAPGGLNSLNYSITFDSGALTVNPATLTYTANPETIKPGQSFPVFTGTVTGFVSRDIESNSTAGTLLFSSPATGTSPPGTYAIDGSGLSASNYLFAQAPGNATALTILGAATGQPYSPFMQFSAQIAPGDILPELVTRKDFSLDRALANRRYLVFASERNENLSLDQGPAIPPACIAFGSSFTVY